MREYWGSKQVEKKKNPWADRGKEPNPHQKSVKILATHDKWNPNTKRILEDTHINEDLLYKKRSCSSRLG